MSDSSEHSENVIKYDIPEISEEQEESEQKKSDKKEKVTKKKKKKSTGGITPKSEVASKIRKKKEKSNGEQTKDKDSLTVLLEHTTQICSDISSDKLEISDDWKESLGQVGSGIVYDVLGDKQDELCKNDATMILDAPDDYMTFVPKLAKNNYVGGISYKDSHVHGYPLVTQHSLALDLAIQPYIYDRFVPKDMQLGWVPGPYLVNAFNESSPSHGKWQYLEASTNAPAEEHDGLNIVGLVAKYL